MFTKYDYKQAVRNDIRDALKDDYLWDCIEQESITTGDDLADFLSDRRARACR